MDKDEEKEKNEGLDDMKKSMIENEERGEEKVTREDENEKELAEKNGEDKDDSEDEDEKECMDEEGKKEIKDEKDVDTQVHIKIKIKLI